MAYHRGLGFAELRQAVVGGRELGGVRVSSRGGRERRICVHRRLQTDDECGERVLGVLKLWRGAQATQQSSRKMTVAEVRTKRDGETWPWNSTCAINGGRRRGPWKKEGRAGSGGTERCKECSMHGLKARKRRTWRRERRGGHFKIKTRI